MTDIGPRVREWYVSEGEHEHEDEYEHEYEDEYEDEYLHAPGIGAPQRAVFEDEDACPP